MFGEVTSLWYVLQWEERGCPENVEIIELGPGKGTLMSDMLRSFQRFPRFAKSIKCIHLVETSAELRRAQSEKLLCKSIEYNDENLGKHKSLNSSVSKYNDTLIKWYNDLDSVEFSKNSCVFAMAHEFFDALPIHKFELGQNGWSEILIDVDMPEPGSKINTLPDKNEYTILSTQNSQISTHTNKSLKQPDNSSEKEIKFKFIKTKKPTINSSAFLTNKRYSELFNIGDSIEVSPESAIIAQKLGKIVNETNGAALIVDYGQNYTQSSTFRGISKHKFLDPLTNPGDIDITADVDFSYLIDIIKPIANTFGPVEQGFFLHEMGIQDRLMQLLKLASTVKDQENLVSMYKRLTDPNSMGRIYKFLAVVPKSVDIAPVAMDPKKN
ncbi:NADH dehydrogenase [ubiquinone] complex I, assembly factor 7 [Smittium culicis]|uniref:Protein arginine methyltransferase NDUFAF7 n=1 Tax=Smittium culicis TaxID=133412 RepID=A0A1R1XCT6_9FUNG|nr:NADH dehydrogenase [ubiquinone] complex I, assembly factor 7 [Smittium culicis]